jgi:hypothetical protein
MLGFTYQPVAQPGSVETVIAYLPTGPAGAKQRWKYSRYWDNPATWTTPGTMDIETYVPGLISAPGPRVATTTVKTMAPTNGQIGPAPDQFEMYNVTVDPAELTNLAGNSDYAPQQQVLAKMLEVESSTKLLQPQMAPWANGSSQQFPFTDS